MKKYIAAAIIVLLVTLISVGCMFPDFSGSGGTSPVKKPFRGVVENNIYTNEYAGLKFTAPDDWTFSADEEMAVLFDVSVDSLGKPGMEFSEQMIESDGVYDMFAINASTGSNIIVMIMGISGFDEAQFFSLLKIRQKADNSNAVFSDIVEEQIGTHNYKVMHFNNGNNEQYCYARKIDDFLVFMTITVSAGDDVSSITECFSAIK